MAVAHPFFVVGVEIDQNHFTDNVKSNAAVFRQ